MANMKEKIEEAKKIISEWEELEKSSSWMEELSSAANELTENHRVKIEFTDTEDVDYIRSYEMRGDQAKQAMVDMAKRAKKSLSDKMNAFKMPF